LMLLMVRFSAISHKMAVFLKSCQSSCNKCPCHSIPYVTTSYTSHKLANEMTARISHAQAA
jgi:hypothetical protein